MTEILNENSYFDEGRQKSKNFGGTSKTEFSADNYLDTRLKKGEETREIQIRIVLTKDIDGKDKVAIPVEVHSIMLNDKQQHAKTISTGKFKSFICLNDPHIENQDERGCPLCNHMREIFTEAENTLVKGSQEWKSMCKQAYKYDSKTAYIVRCIERGHESDGIKFWRFNKRDDGSGIFDKLVNMYTLRKKRGIDMFDYQNGLDIILTLTQDIDPTPGAPTKTVISLDADILQSPLSDNMEQIESWVNDTKDWRDMYRSKSYDYLKIVADGESPVWNRELGKFVEWRDPEELKREDNDIIEKAMGELNLKPHAVGSQEQPEDESQYFNEELPF